MNSLCNTIYEYEKKKINFLCISIFSFHLIFAVFMRFLCIRILAIRIMIVALFGQNLVEIATLKDFFMKSLSFRHVLIHQFYLNNVSLFLI